MTNCRQVTPWTIATNITGWTKAIAVSMSTTPSTCFHRIIDRPGPYSSYLPGLLPVLLARMTAETAGLSRSQRLGLEPRGGRLLVRRSRHGLLNPLEPLLRLFLIAEPVIAVRQSDHQLAARVRPDTVEVGGLQLVSLLEISDAFFDQRTRHLRARNVLGGSTQDGPARDDDAQLIRRARYGTVHFLDAAR